MIERRQRYSQEDHIGGRISRRTLLKAALAGGGLSVLSGALAACAPAGAPPAGAPAKPGAPEVKAKPEIAAEKLQAIEFLNWSVGELEHAIEPFTEATGVPVKVWPAPARYEDKMRTLLASGMPADIMRVNDDYVVGYASKGQLLDLTPFLDASDSKREDFFEFIWDFPIHEGGYWAWSIANKPRLIFYNVDHFKEAGLDLPTTKWDPEEGWTWDDFLEAAKKLTKGEERFGCAVYQDTGYEETFARNNGAEGIYSKEKDPQRFTLADPPGIEAVQWATDLTCVHGVQPTRGLLAQMNATQLFMGGKLSMVFITMDVTPQLREEIADFEWDVTAVPMRKHRFTEGSLVTFCIPKEAKNPEGAWQLLEWLSNQEMGELLASERRYVPVRKSAAETIVPDDLPPANVQLFIEGNRWHKSVNFAENTERARFIYRPQLDLVYTCKESAEEVLTGLRPEIEAALAGEF